MSEADRNITLPISPVEVSSNIDLANPVEHSREPRRIPRKPPKGRGKKRVKLKENKLEQGLLPGLVRKLKWAELFYESRYAVELIQQMREGYPVPREVDVWVKEIIASGVPEDQRDKFIVALHPGIRRFALFELVRRPDKGPAYKCVSVFHTGGKPGHLPLDLQSSDKRWAHLRGDVGEFRQPTRRDFEIIREWADRRTLGGVGVAKKQEQREKEEYNKKSRVEEDFVEDMHDYMFWWLNTVANNGTKQYSVQTIDVKSNPDTWYIERRPGYTVKVNKLHNAALVEKLRAEGAGVEITAQPTHWRTDIDDDWLRRTLAARAERIAKDEAEAATMTPELRAKQREEAAAAARAVPVADETIEAFLARRRARIEAGELKEVAGERVYARTR